METKKYIIENINSVGIIKGRNRMGVSENFYNPFFMMKKLFIDKNIDANSLTKKELNYIYITANFASDMFY